MISNYDELVGISEIAEIAKVSRQAVTNWRGRFADFPEPVANLASGPIFLKSKVKLWLKKRRTKMASIFSVINLKGGVGKTTTTVALAEAFSSELHKKVLVVDLDPQTNATTMLIGEDKWRALNDAEWTLARLFKDALEQDLKRFDFEKSVQRKVSSVSSAKTIDLLPSSLDLIDVQDRLATIGPGRFFTVNPIEILWRAVKSRVDEYDVVIVDCPPNMGIITLNGLRMSQGFVIPTVPDILSTYGIPQIVKRVHDFSVEISEDVEPLGVIITKYQSSSTVHNSMLRHLPKLKECPSLFRTVIPQANQLAAAAEFAKPSTFKQKWGYNGLAEKWVSLANEIMERLDG